ncbi:threonine--tRNA ligase [bacterium]|nr:threonine--tRNA ligase [bacterium]
MAKGKNKIETIRHSLAHILAMAVKELYPDALFGIGPAIENGFYYDFDLPKKINPKDLAKIEKKMKEIIKKNISFKKKFISKKEAKKIFKNQSYKLELIKELPGEKVSIYKSGDFIDLCKGPHIKSSQEVNPDAFRLTKIAGAYWKGSEENKMLTRIYGVSFETKNELKKYLKIQEEAKKRDHRILGQKLELFIFDEEVGAGLPLWLPKGETLRHTIEEYLYNNLGNQGYQWVRTPHIGNIKLWKTSGHWNLYKENMYSPIKIEQEQYLLKPMNCPFHVKIYQSKIRSYKNLPLKLAELGTVYRYERSGTLHGLTRVRGFTQDDAHIWCTPKQLNAELVKLLKYGLNILKEFGFKNFNIYLSTRPEKYAGTLTEWKKATNTLKYVLGKLGLKYETDKGGGVFYGPKIDIKIKDSLNREWQCTTIQVDFNLPERFDITYINEKGKKKRPIMIHRALLGSLERFIGVLIEHYSGALPLWLSPIQALVIPVGAEHRTYAKEIAEKLKEEEIRAEAKTEAETVSKKIRDGEAQKIPYLIVVGDKEIKRKKIRVRKRGKGDIGEMKITKFLNLLKTEIKNKK